MKYALINTEQLATVERYCPSNYRATALGVFTLVYGHDHLGWTLEDYVLPRMAQWGLYPVSNEDTIVLYQDGIFSLWDRADEFGMPADEVRVYTQADWEAQVNAGHLKPPKGYVAFGPSLVEEQVDLIIESRNSRLGLDMVLDPGFDYQAAADYANTKLRAPYVVLAKVRSDYQANDYYWKV